LCPNGTPWRPRLAVVGTSASFASLSQAPPWPFPLPLSPPPRRPAPPPSLLPLCDSALCLVLFPRAPLTNLRPVAPAPILPYLPRPPPISSPPPSFSAVLFPLFLLLYAYGGSSADLTTAQLMCPRTPTLTAPPFGRLYSFWFLTHPCSYTRTSLVVLLNTLAGTQAGGDAVAATHEQPRAPPPTSSPGPSQPASASTGIPIATRLSRPYQQAVAS